MFDFDFLEKEKELERYLILMSAIEDNDCDDCDRDVTLCLNCGYCFYSE